jgi:hypothetical protein
MRTSPTPTHPLREICKHCGGSDGRIETRGGQDCVYCKGCDRYQYNAPRLETGRAERTLATRPGITPAQRARILDKFEHACISCGGRPPRVELTLEHIISRELADEHGMLDALIVGEFNLAPMCPECNSGHRRLPRPAVELMYRCLQMSALPKP